MWRIPAHRNASVGRDVLWIWPGAAGTPNLPPVGFRLPVPAGPAGLALASRLGGEVIRADHGEGFLPARSHFAPLYLARYEYGRALKMIRADIPLSSRITSAALVRKAALALTGAPACPPRRGRARPAETHPAGPTHPILAVWGAAGGPHRMPTPHPLPQVPAGCGSPQGRGTAGTPSGAQLRAQHRGQSSLVPAPATLPVPPGHPLRPVEMQSSRSGVKSLLPLPGSVPEAFGHPPAPHPRALSHPPVPCCNGVGAACGVLPAGTEPGDKGHQPPPRSLSHRGQWWHLGWPLRAAQVLLGHPPLLSHCIALSQKPGRTGGYLPPKKTPPALFCCLLFGVGGLRLMGAFGHRGKEGKQLYSSR